MKEVNKHSDWEEDFDKQLEAVLEARHHHTDELVAKAFFKEFIRTQIDKAKEEGCMRDSHGRLIMMCPVCEEEHKQS